MVKKIIAPILVMFGMIGCATVHDTRDVVKVVVQRDDSLNSIAQMYDTDWRSIAVMNRSELTNGLQEGQVLLVRPGPNAKMVEQNDQTDNHQHTDDDQAEGEDLDFLAKRKKGLLEGPSANDPGDLIFPAQGRISSKFGKRGRRQHRGIDIAANIGSPIVAAGDGEVIFSGRQRGYGLTIVIDHGQFMTLYAHASKLIARNGDRVRQGDYIAKIGRTGNARGVHLHFELRNSENKPIDPLPYLKHRSIAKAPERDLPRLVKSSSRAKQPKVARSGKGRSAKKGLLYARD